MSFYDDLSMASQQKLNKIESPLLLKSAKQHSQLVTGSSKGGNAQFLFTTDLALVYSMVEYHAHCVCGLLVHI